MKLKRVERETLAANLETLANPPKREQPSQDKMDLQRIVSMRHRHEERRGWKPGKPVSRIQRYLLNLAHELYFK